MSKAILINGDNGQLEDWSQVNWQKAYKVVKNLRCRIFRAKKTWSVEAVEKIAETVNKKPIKSIAKC